MADMGRIVVGVMVGFLPLVPASLAAPPPVERASASIEDADLRLERLKLPQVPGERIGFLKKRIVGGPLQVIPEAVMEYQLDDSRPFVETSERTFAVIGPKGYSWRFTYDRSKGVPEFRYVAGSTVQEDAVEVVAPDGRLFGPSDVKDISYKNGLRCTNVGTCQLCNCCFICYCNTGTYCDSDDTGIYDWFTGLRAEHEVRLY